MFTSFADNLGRSWLGPRVQRSADVDAAPQDSLQPAILFLCPDTDVPTGGVMVIYRHVEYLTAAGLRAHVLHAQPGFRCDWFESSASVMSSVIRPVTPDDVLVVPETYGPHLDEIAPGTPKVVFNQNPYLSFHRWPVPVGDRTPEASPYRSPEVVATVVVSEHSREYLYHAFPGLKVYAVANPADAAPPAPKQDLVVYMSRKNPDHAAQVLNILAARDALSGFAVRAIDSVNHAECLAILARARVFLSFGYPEGSPLPPLEAMAAGCLVVGYDGGGGRDFLTTENSYPIAFGDILGYARTVEGTLQAFRADASELERRIAAGQRLARSKHSDTCARDSVVSAWWRILADIGPAGSSLAAVSASGSPTEWHHTDRRQIELEQARLDRDQALRERDDARAQIAALRGSSSWRLTRLLRVVGAIVRRSERDPTPRADGTQGRRRDPDLS